MLVKSVKIIVSGDLVHIHKLMAAGKIMVTFVLLSS